MVSEAVNHPCDFNEATAKSLTANKLYSYAGVIMEFYLITHKQAFKF